MTTRKAILAGLALIALIAALCAGFILGLAAPAWTGWDGAVAAYQRGDYATAIRELLSRTKQGNADAQVNRGVNYERGEGVPQVYAKDLQWYHKAAEQGDANAQSVLGFMYGEAQGVPQSYILSHMWLNIAASRFPPGEHRDNALNNRDIVAKRMTPAQISVAEKLAREWKPKK